MTKTFRKYKPNNSNTAYKGQRKYDNSSARNSLRQMCHYNNGSCPYDDWDYSSRFCERKSDVWNFFPQHKKKYDDKEKFPLATRYNNYGDSKDKDGDSDNDSDNDGDNDEYDSTITVVEPTRREINRTKERFYINGRINTRVEIDPYFQTFDEYMMVVMQEFFATL